MRAFVAAIAIGTLTTAGVSCSPPSIGAYPEDGNEPRRTSARKDAAAEEDEERAADPPATVTGDAVDPVLTITLKGNGTGAITSTPGGVTCTGTTCRGSFAKGTSVTLIAAPSGGAMFAGWSGTACAGVVSCAPKMDADVALTAEFSVLGGTWTGAYTHSQKGGVDDACTFNNKGDVTATFTQNGDTLTSTTQMTGFELRNPDNCALGSVQNGATNAPAAITSAGGTMTGTWVMKINQASGTLPLPFSATISGNELKGTWTCAGCTGSFSLTKP